ncbi:hypothetical protein M8C21_030007 [Ambrosia artemisiifolia]|uniref:Uncharacterized protein n=1 Tax=Ambrosia artemisiifolia TaxID=4212 RepID=A0AAD5GLR5_AMBAR|nr:hypothetical protein M8C21_030007 [Ambrosia artemisiifolia]
MPSVSRILDNPYMAKDSLVEEGILTGSGGCCDV